MILHFVHPIRPESIRRRGEKVGLSCAETPHDCPIAHLMTAPLEGHFVVGMPRGGGAALGRWRLVVNVVVVVVR